MNFDEDFILSDVRNVKYDDLNVLKIMYLTAIKNNEIEQAEHFRNLLIINGGEDIFKDILIEVENAKKK